MKLLASVAYQEHLAGMSQSQIAQKHGVSRSRVSQLLKTIPEYKPPANHSPKVPWTPERRSHAVALYASGMPIAQLEKACHTNWHTIHRILRDAGVSIRPQGVAQSGQYNPCWRGGRLIDEDGYVLVFLPQHPHANSNGYVREHRLVMEEKIGRYLLPEEVVHHTKGKQDNSPDHLMLFPNNAAHLAYDLKGRTPKWTEDGKRRMQEAAQRRSIAARSKRDAVALPSSIDPKRMSV